MKVLNIAVVTLISCLFELSLSVEAADRSSDMKMPKRKHES
jgi:hypothetical protein